MLIDAGAWQCVIQACSPHHVPTVPPALGFLRRIFETYISTDTTPLLPGQEPRKLDGTVPGGSCDTLKLENLIYCFSVFWLR